MGPILGKEEEEEDILEQNPNQYFKYFSQVNVANYIVTNFQHFLLVVGHPRSAEGYLRLERTSLEGHPRSAEGYLRWEGDPAVLLRVISARKGIQMFC
jgi:hypothetical protein